jgi:hypothetical protein
MQGFARDAILFAAGAVAAGVVFVVLRMLGYLN